MTNIKDWKIQTIELLAENQKKLDDLKIMMDNDTKLQTLKDELKELQSYYAKLKKPYEKVKKDLKTKVLNDWDINDKTFKCENGSLTKKTHKVLKISNKKNFLDWIIKSENDSYLNGIDITFDKKMFETLFETHDISTDYMNYMYSFTVAFKSTKK